MTTSTWPVRSNGSNFITVNRQQWIRRKHN